MEFNYLDLLKHESNLKCGKQKTQMFKNKVITPHMPPPLVVGKREMSEKKPAKHEAIKPKK
jgi:hypothetical protein